MISAGYRRIRRGRFGRRVYSPAFDPSLGYRLTHTAAGGPYGRTQQRHETGAATRAGHAVGVVAMNLRTVREQPNPVRG